MFIKRIFKSDTPRAITQGFVKLFRTRPRLLLCVAGLCLLSALAGALWVREQARRSLAEERARSIGQEFIPFEKSARVPLRRNEIKFWQNTEATRDLIRFQDSYFAATDGGLVQFTPEGNSVRHYTVLDGLTESDLTALAVFDSKLFIGTRSEGLLAFDGERFESYRWLDRKAQAVTTLLADGGRLLVGTFAGGLIEFDGRRFAELRAGAERVRLRAVNCLTKDGPRLYIGTFDDGLWLLEAGRWLHFQTSDGLASNRVVGIAAHGGQLFVASDFGLSMAASDGLQEASPSRAQSFRTLATLPSLTSLIAYGDLLILSKDDGELLALDREATGRQPAPVKNTNWPRPSEFSGSRLALVDDALWLLGSRGVWRAREDALARARAQLSWTPFGREGEGAVLTTNVINALALDRGGNFWAGNFRRGIDVLSAEGKKITHLESEAVREINFLRGDAGAKDAAVLAATSQGLVRFDEQFRATGMTKADGLPSNSVMHLAVSEGAPGAREADYAAAHSSRAGDPLVLATTRGLSLGRPGRLRQLTTVQGLPSDQVYTTLFFRGALFVGTLGGLAQIDADRIVRVFKDSNSKLTHNWVTGLCVASGRLFVGTYGGGVFELAASNELHSFSAEIGTTVVVNPNAMWSDNELLFVGTLDGAWVFDLHSQKWTHLKDELPARTVLSVAGDDRYVYFGTTSGVARIEKSYLNGL